MDSDESAPVSTTPSENATRVRDLLQVLVRAQKSLRLYETENPITQRMEDEVFGSLSALLEDRGRIDLAVRSFQIFLDNEVVYENRERKESLAFLFFRDGIRSLSFFPGLTREELKGFLTCLNQVRAVVGGEDDLVTLFWEQDFHSIRYLAVDELSEQGLGARVSEQLASGALLEVVPEGGETATDERGPPAGGSADELDLPVSRMPVESAHLSESEIEALRSEIAAEERLDLAMMVADIAVELTLVVDDEQEREALSQHLVDALDQRLVEEDWDCVVRILERLWEHSRAGLEGSEAGEQLATAVLGALADGSRSDRVMALLEDRPQLDAREQLLLRRLCDVALPMLVGWLARVRKPSLRRASADALLTAGTGSLAELGRQLAAMGDDPQPEFAQEVLHIMHHVVHPDALPILERLLSVGDAELRRDTALVLRHFGDKEPTPLWLQLLSDPEPQIRGLAMTALARADDVNLGPEIRRRVLGDDALVRDARERRRAFAVLAQLEGDRALKWLRPLLQPPKKRWFLSREQQELLAAAAYGVRAVGTPAADSLLRGLAKTGDRYCKAACLAELTALEPPAPDEPLSGGDGSEEAPAEGASREHSDAGRQAPDAGDRGHRERMARIVGDSQPKQEDV